MRTSALGPASRPLTARRLMTHTRRVPDHGTVGAQGVLGAGTSANQSHLGIVPLPHDAPVDGRSGGCRAD